MRDAQDAIIGYLLIGTDNTARRQVEDERQRLEHTLQQKNVELEEASRMKSELLANMSHELRTPLNAINGFSEVLRDGLIGEMTAHQRGFIGDIFNSGKHLLSLINDILDLSKVEAGRMTLDLEPVEIAAAFSNSLSIVSESAALQHIRLELEAEEGLDIIHADARKVKQIVYNLLSNAVKFTGEGGRGARRWPSATSPTSSKISVTDSGIGISTAGLAQLFTPFNQIDSGLARRFEGTGLGLALVKLLAELHGGAVAVESAGGEGARFTVWLPLRTAPEAIARVYAPSKPRIDMPLGVRTALVVEDDFRSADLIRVQLEAEGFKVLHAASAEAALALAVQQPLSLITLDILLPHMDGWKFLAALKQIPDLRSVPVVIISILADRNKGFSLGAAAVMPKPFSRQELYESLSDLGMVPVGYGKSLKVLIVDDDFKAMELMALQILGLPGTVLRAYGGREAIESARRDRPDVILLDLMMPEVNGFDVVEALRLAPDTARIPILIVTAKPIDAAARAKLNGFVSVIMEKGQFDTGRITDEIRRAMAGRQPVA